MEAPPTTANDHDDSNSDTHVLSTASPLKTPASEVIVSKPTTTTTIRRRRKRETSNASSSTTPRGVLFVVALIMVGAFQTLQINKFPSFDYEIDVQVQWSTPQNDNATPETKPPPPPPTREGLLLHRPYIPISDLTTGVNETQQEQQCKTDPNMVFIHDQVLPINHSKKIPNIVHQTTKSRCLHSKLAPISQVWRDLEGWSYYLHDDDAIWNLVYGREWPEFPHLKTVIRCLKSMTAVSDVWRYLVLWEYGGMYVDLDSVPNTWTPDFLAPEDDAYFVVENYRAPSQYWMAVSPRHPLMYYAIQQSLLKTMASINTGIIDAAFVTGPFALLDAFSWFMLDVNEIKGKPVEAGLYEGRYNRSVRIVGEGFERSNDIIKREALGRNKKMALYHAMNMSHFLEDKKKGRQSKDGKSCHAITYDLLLQQRQQQQRESQQQPPFSLFVTNATSPAP